MCERDIGGSSALNVIGLLIQSVCNDLMTDSLLTDNLEQVMGTNPLRTVKYDAREFHQWNFGVKRSIAAYEEDMAIQRRGRYPRARINEAGERICADPVCDQVLNHQRSFLCEAHREGRYQATKHKAYRIQEVRDERLRSVRVPGVPGLESDRD